MRRVHRRTRGEDSSAASFNDLLFNCLGVFLLLLLVMMTMIGVPDVSIERLAQAEHARKQLEAAIASTRQAADLAAAERDLAQATASALQPKPIAVTIAIDGTLSMAPTLKEQQSAALTVAEIGARLSPHFQLGVVVYRDAANTVVFPLTEICPSVNGRASPGMVALRSFLTAHMKPIGAAANVEGGIDTALTMVQGVPAGTRRALVVLGDTGPWEGGALDVIESQDRRSEERCVQMVRAFSGGPDSRLLTVFTGRHLTGLRHVPETVTFFKRLAEGGGQYSEDTSQIAAAMLEMLLAPSN